MADAREISDEERVRQIVSLFANHQLAGGGWSLATVQTLSNHIADVRRAGAESMRERAIQGIDSRVKWLMREARGGGDFDHLKARADEATHLAKWLRALDPDPSTVAPAKGENPGTD